MGQWGMYVGTNRAMEHVHGYVGTNNRNSAYIFFIPLVLICFMYAVLPMNIDATRWPSPSNRYLWRERVT